MIAPEKSGDGKRKRGEVENDRPNPLYRPAFFLSFVQADRRWKGMEERGLVHRVGIVDGLQAWSLGPTPEHWG